ncbi:TPA: hypothetical protein ACOJPH_001829 [Vibrio campbellii]|uniref:hypothetical protein n=1 Tax=Vibrio campbellii TaxID=680 RepID=UPI00390B2AAE
MLRRAVFLSKFFIFSHQSAAILFLLETIPQGETDDVLLIWFQLIFYPINTALKLKNMGINANSITYYLGGSIHSLNKVLYKAEKRHPRAFVGSYLAGNWLESA